MWPRHYASAQRRPLHDGYPARPAPCHRWPFARTPAVHTQHLVGKHTIHLQKYASTLYTLFSTKNTPFKENFYQPARQHSVAVGTLCFLTCAKDRRFSFKIHAERLASYSSLSIFCPINDTQRYTPSTLWVCIHNILPKIGSPL